MRDMLVRRCMENDVGFSTQTPPATVRRRGRPIKPENELCRHGQFHFPADRHYFHKYQTQRFCAD